MARLVDIGPVVLEKKMFKFLPCIFGFFHYYLFGKWCGPSFQQTIIPFIQERFVPSLMKGGPVVKKVKM